VCFPSPGSPSYGWLRRPSRLQMNSLRSALTATEANHKSPDIRAKKNIRYELTRPQKLLTSTGLLMEGQCTHRHIVIGEASNPDPQPGPQKQRSYTTSVVLGVPHGL
jgi:hypothetical protein